MSIPQARSTVQSVRQSGSFFQRSLYALNAYLQETSYRKWTLWKRLRSIITGNARAIIFVISVPTLVAIMKEFICPHAFSDLSGWKAIVTIFLTVAALVVMTQGGAPDITMVAINIVLMLCTIITPKEAIAGLQSTSILAVGVLFVVAKGIEQAGTINALLTLCLGNPSSVPIAIIRLSFPVAVISAFM